MATTTAPPLRKALKRRAPGLAAEREMWDAGCRTVVGIDEVGRGSWAGSVDGRCRGVAAATDASTRCATRRCSPSASVRPCSTGSPSGASPGPSVGRRRTSATRWACRTRSGWRRAGPSTASACQPDGVLLDGNWDFVGAPNTRRIVKGDATCLSIAAASILAKVTRDRLMRAEAENYPGYDFELEQGLSVPPTQDGSGRHGPDRDPSRGWVFMDHIPWTGIPRRAAARPAARPLRRELS